jgi:hypothetical protein
MFKFFRFTSVFAVVAATACATAVPPERQAKMLEVDRTIPICTSDKDCAAKWEMAQLWVVKNAAFKLQTVTNVLLETYNPTPHSVDFAARVLKEPLGNGKYKLVARVWCDNIYGCNRDAWDMLLDFNRTVNASQ